jgi:hypothetical protein
LQKINYYLIEQIRFFQMGGMGTLRNYCKIGLWYVAPEALGLGPSISSVKVTP